MTILIIMMIGQFSQLTQNYSDMYLQTHDGWKNAAPENAALIVAYREECIDKNKASKQPLMDKEAEVNCAKKMGVYPLYRQLQEHPTLNAQWPLKLFINDITVTNAI
ncbi:hypothetical protein [Aliivibrio fischeri]|uniref:hypothetical protein n=1 Tax=Aliivibrio fischeri TaxID=668 RepID=UPI0011BD73F4|nr:hypothetical protein [Aliivibrio fischeri]